MRIALLAAIVLGWAVAPASAANGWWTFNRNANLNSTLTWKWTYPPSPAEYGRSWRGGSGTTTLSWTVSSGIPGYSRRSRAATVSPNMR